MYSVRDRNGEVWLVYNTELTAMVRNEIREISRSFPNIVFSQINIICPLPNAIIQKVSDSGYLRILCTSNNTKKISLKIADGFGNEIPGFGWRDLSFTNNILDTAFSIPVVGNFNINWRNIDIREDSGIIPSLAVGHVYGIAGQSNAQGWSYPNYIPPQGNIRMLLSNIGWQLGIGTK